MKMKADNLPGFTAENSIGNISKVTYRTGMSYSAAVSSFLVAQGITCMKYCDGSGDCGYIDCTITGDDPGGFGVGFGGNQDQRNCARCRLKCYNGPANKRKACLTNCDDTVC